MKKRSQIEWSGHSRYYIKVCNKSNICIVRINMKEIG